NIKNIDGDIVDISSGNFTKAKSFIYNMRSLFKIMNISNNQINRSIIINMLEETLQNSSMSEIAIDYLIESKDDDISILKNFLNFKPDITNEDIDLNDQTTIFVRDIYNKAVSKYIYNSNRDMKDFLTIEVPNYGDVYHGIDYKEI